MPLFYFFPLSKRSDTTSISTHSHTHTYPFIQQAQSSALAPQQPASPISQNPMPCQTRKRKREKKNMSQIVTHHHGTAKSLTPVFLKPSPPTHTYAVCMYALIHLHRTGNAFLECPDRGKRARRSDGPHIQWPPYMYLAFVLVLVFLSVCALSIYLSVLSRFFSLSLSLFPAPG